MKKPFLTIATLLLGIIISNAQNQIDNIYKINFRNSDAIKEGSDVKGYYFFYASDKVDKEIS